MDTRHPTRPTIGVFDSGFGGLTVLRALLPLVPGAHYIYLGDTARLPYGAKSQATIARYAVESARFLAAQGCDHLVIACNTATALALDEIVAAVDIPVIGVIEPGANAVVATGYQHIPTLALPPTPSSRPERSGAERPLYLSSVGSATESTSVLVLATQATVDSHAYLHACARRELVATEKACPLLVPLVEEGWTNHPVTDEVLRIYLNEALSTCTPQAVLLGCTHYPLIAPAIERTLRQLGSNALVIDSAMATAQAVAAVAALKPGTSNLEPSPATFTCYATDSIEKFQRLGSHFLGQQIPQVHLLDLGG
jgi:glutamate racemase